MATQYVYELKHVKIHLSALCVQNLVAEVNKIILNELNVSLESTFLFSFLSEAVKFKTGTSSLENIFSS